MIISAIPTQEQVIAWLEDLRAHPDREIGTDTGTITARTLLERYVEPGAFEHMGPGNIRWALRRQGWVL